MGEKDECPLFFSIFSPMGTDYGLNDPSALQQQSGANLGMAMLAGALFGGGKPKPKPSTTPAGRPLSPHYEFGEGPCRNIPGSVVDSTIDNYPGVGAPSGTTVYYDPVNDVTVVTGNDGIVSAHRGPPRPGQF